MNGACESALCSVLGRGRWTHFGGGESGGVVHDLMDEVGATALTGQVDLLRVA